MPELPAGETPDPREVANPAEIEVSPAKSPGRNTTYLETAH